jgi:hypothetical protein
MSHSSQLPFHTYEERLRRMGIRPEKEKVHRIAASCWPQPSLKLEEPLVGFLDFAFSM